MSKFTVGQEVETRDGSKARVICADAKIGGGDYNLVALIALPDGTDFIEWYDERNEHEGSVTNMPSIKHIRDLKIPQAK